MAAIPFIKSVYGYWNNSTNKGLITVYLTNYKRGYISYNVTDIPTGRVTTYNTCVEKYEGFDTISFIPLSQNFTNVKIDVYKCISGEICQNMNPSTCTTTLLIDSIMNIPIQVYDETKPQLIDGLTSVITPQALTFHWNKSLSNNVVAYYFELIDEQNSAVRYGMLVKDTNNITLGDLNKNSTYKFRIRPVTASYILGDYSITTLQTETQINSSSNLIIGLGLLAAGIYTYKKYWKQ